LLQFVAEAANNKSS